MVMKTTYNTEKRTEYNTIYVTQFSPQLLFEIFFAAINV
jgi:hypothetical protein